MEFEKPLSQHSLEEVNNEFKMRRIEMPDIVQGYNNKSDSIAFLESKGFEKIQTHCTDRERKNVISNKQNDVVLAEIDIDRVIKG